MGGESRDEREVKDQGESYVSAGAGTDLIPGLYEGGLKTWEGGLDLIEVLSTGMGEGDIGDWVKGSGALEVRLSLLLITPSSRDTIIVPHSPGEDEQRLIPRLDVGQHYLPLIYYLDYSLHPHHHQLNHPLQKQSNQHVYYVKIITSQF